MAANASVASRRGFRIGHRGSRSVAPALALRPAVPSALWRPPVQPRAKTPTRSARQPGTGLAKPSADARNPINPVSAKAPAAPAAAVDDTVEAPRKSRKKLFVTLVLATVLVGGGGAGAWWWSSHAKPAHKEAEKKLPTQYFAMEPSFVVNLADTDAVRYLQADVQLATRDPETLKALEEQAPAVRNRLLLLFGQQTSDQLVQRSGKERLQDKALAEVKSVLKHEGASDKVDAVFFTSLVTQ